MKIFVELDVPEKITAEELVILIRKQEGYTIRSEQDIADLAGPCTLEQIESTYPINDSVLKKLEYYGRDAVEYAQSHKWDENYQSILGAGNALVGLALILGRKL